jgi:hypothetical protein
VQRTAGFFLVRNFEEGSVMDTSTAKRKRRRLATTLAVTGFVIAAAIWAYSELTNSSPPHFSFPLWTAFMILCPPSLLSIPLIDVEPGASGFTIMWLLIGAVNSALYAVIGFVVGKSRWKAGGAY